ncbi:MAG: response regulator [Rhodobacteraceae bacterium]|nr:response regulator [Paracoccaceae bacterium]MCZ8332721.1 response regulator [Paracoccaceae bacterium]
MRIVCVDDDPIFLSILGEYLRELDPISVTTFGDPERVAKLAAEGTLLADVLLLDMEMPGMDGTTLCAALRATELHRATPIIMISSVTARDRVKGALAAGANEFLHKPLDKMELGARLSMVAQVLDERAKSAAMAADMGSLRDQADFSFRFEDPVLPGSDVALMDYLALENHLLGLGWAGLPGTVALGFRLRNAPWAYAHLDRMEYCDFLSETAAMIVQQMKGVRFRMAYAGAGDFVTVLERGQRVEMADLQAGLQAARGPMWAAYRALGLPAPEVAVGPVVQAPLIGASASRLLRTVRLRLDAHAPLMHAGSWEAMPSGLMAPGAGAGRISATLH